MARINVTKPVDAEIINKIEAKYYECETATRNVAYELSKGYDLSNDSVKYQLDRLHKFYPIYNSLKDDFTKNVVYPIVKENGGNGTCTWNIAFDKKEVNISMDLGEWNDETTDADLSIPAEKAAEIEAAKNDSEIYGDIISYLGTNGLIQSVPESVMDELNDLQVKAMRDYGNGRNMISNDVVIPYLSEKGITDTVTWNLDFKTGKVTFVGKIG